MEQNIEVYERMIDKLINIHKDSKMEIFGALKNLGLFSDDFLLQIISYLKIGRLYQIVCEELPDFKYFNLIIGESNFFYHDDNHCICNTSFKEKIKNKNICKHFLTFKILLGINNYTKIYFDKEEMIQLIKEKSF